MALLTRLSRAALTRMPVELPPPFEMSAGAIVLAIGAVVIAVWVLG